MQVGYRMKDHSRLNRDHVHLHTGHVQQQTKSEASMAMQEDARRQRIEHDKLAECGLAGRALMSRKFS